MKKVEGGPLNNLRYADDTVLLAENISNLQIVLNNVITSSQEYDVTLNVK